MTPDRHNSKRGLKVNCFKKWKRFYWNGSRDTPNFRKAARMHTIPKKDHILMAFGSEVKETATKLKNISDIENELADLMSVCQLDYSLILMDLPEEERMDCSASFGEELKTYLISTLEEAAEIRKIEDQFHEAKIADALQYYSDCLSKVTAADYILNQNALHVANILAKPIIIEQFKHDTIERGHPNAEGFMDQLELKMKEEFTRQESKSKAELDAFNNKIDAEETFILNQYETYLFSQLEICPSMLHLALLMAVQKTKANTMLKERMSGMNDAVINLRLEKLCMNLELKNLDMRDGFEIVLDTRSKETEAVIAEARKMYETEWKKHCANSKFKKLQELVENDDKIQSLIEQRILSTKKLLPIQIADIKKALHLTFQTHKREFDLSSGKDFALGIDLGTTYTCVAVYQHGEVKIIPNPVGQSIIPSCVRIGDNGKMEEVGIVAKDTSYKYIENTVIDAKRIIGRKFEDPRVQQALKSWAINIVEENGVPKFAIGPHIIPPERISAEILKEMKRMADVHLGMNVTKAVITVPAYFGDTQRQATIDAAKGAGLQILAILPEPIAASVAFRLDHFDTPTRTVFIFDLGGGTFDVAVLKMTHGDIETIAIGGDSYLGGRDFDHNMMKYCVAECLKDTGIDLMAGSNSDSALERRATKRRLQRIQSVCETKKLHLSAFTCNMVEIDIPAIYSDGTKFLDLKVDMTRAKFEEINKPLFDITIAIVDECLKSKNISKQAIDDIVLVGGSTKIPKIRELLSTYFEGAALSHHVNPDEAVAYGAAIHAAVLNGQISRGELLFTTIQDITPISIGIEVVGNQFSKIIPRHTRIPATLMVTYDTVDHNQTRMAIRAYQGEHIDIALNSLLGNFTLSGIPPAPPGDEPVDVTMEINTNGVLNVTAVCRSTGKGGNVQIKANKWLLSDEEIKDIRSSVG